MISTRFVLEGLGAGAVVAEAAVGDLDGIAAAIHCLADLVVIGVREENPLVVLGIDGLGQVVVLLKVILGDPPQGIVHLDAGILEVVDKAGAAASTIGLGDGAAGCVVGVRRAWA